MKSPIKRNIKIDIEPRDLLEFETQTSNIYEAIIIIGKRARQLAQIQKEELHGKLAEFAPSTDSLEEVFENKEQIEISAYYERLPKPTLVAINQFSNKEIYFRNPIKNKESK